MSAINIFGDLLEFRYRGISLPTLQFSLKLRHDLVQHKLVGVDGAHVEATGLCPLEHTARIPFLNNITAAAYENWSQGLLYPNTFRRFLTAMSDRTLDTLQHPELGPITVRPESLQCSWMPDTRDGVIVEASWIQSTENQASLQAILAAPVFATLPAAANSASALDSVSTTIQAIPQVPVMMNGIAPGRKMCWMNQRRGTLNVRAMSTRSASPCRAAYAETVDSAEIPAGGSLAMSPSGLDVTPARTPMRPPAPGLLSTTTGWPSAWPNRSAMKRAMKSLPPPGVKGTISVIGWPGYGASCAAAAWANARAASAAVP